MFGTSKVEKPCYKWKSRKKIVYLYKWEDKPLKIWFKPFLNKTSSHLGFCRHQYISGAELLMWLHSFEPIRMQEFSREYIKISDWVFSLALVGFVKFPRPTRTNPVYVQEGDYGKVAKETNIATFGFWVLVVHKGWLLSRDECFAG